MNLEVLLVQLLGMVHHLSLFVDRRQVVQAFRNLAEGGIVLLFQVQLEEWVLNAVSQ